MTVTSTPPSEVWVSGTATGVQIIIPRTSCKILEDGYNFGGKFGLACVCETLDNRPRYLSLCLMSMGNLENTVKALHLIGFPEEFMLHIHKAWRKGRATSICLEITESKRQEIRDAIKDAARGRRRVDDLVQESPVAHTGVRPVPRTKRVGMR